VRKHSILSVVFILVASVSIATTGKFDIIDSAMKKLIIEHEKIKEICNNYPEDVQIHLGAAELWRELAHFMSLPTGFIPIKDRYRQVLELNNRNLPAYSVLITKLYQSYILKWEMLLEELKRKEEYAKEYNLKEISLHPDRSDLYEYLKSDTEKEVIIKDFQQAKCILENKLEEEALSILEEIEKAQKVDKDNSLYNYFKASLYYTLRSDQKAFEEVKKGLQKEYFSVYAKERAQARALVLEKMNFPWPERAVFILSYSALGAGAIKKVHKNLIRIGKRYESTGELMEAERLYTIIVNIGKQLEENSFFLGEARQGLKIQKLGYQSLEKLYKKMEKEEKREKILKNIQTIMGKEAYYFELVEHYFQFHKKRLSPKELLQLKKLVNQILEKGEIETLRKIRR